MKSSKPSIAGKNLLTKVYSKPLFSTLSIDRLKEILGGYEIKTKEDQQLITKEDFNKALPLLIDDKSPYKNLHLALFRNLEWKSKHNPGQESKARILRILLPWIQESKENKLNTFLYILGNKDNVSQKESNSDIIEYFNTLVVLTADSLYKHSDEATKDLNHKEIAELKLDEISRIHKHHVLEFTDKAILNEINSKAKGEYLITKSDLRTILQKHEWLLDFDETLDKFHDTL